MTPQRWLRVSLLALALALASAIAGCASLPRFDSALEACTAHITPSESIYVEIRNLGDEPVDLYWVRPVSGELVPYQQLAPASARQQVTYVGHLWVALRGRQVQGAPVCVLPDTTRIDFAASSDS
jgi:hypothetical protein